MAVWGGLTNSCEKKRTEKPRRKEKINAELQRIAKRDKKAFFSDQCKGIRGIEQNGKRLETSSRKLEIPREQFHAKNGLDKGQKWYGPNRSRRY